MQKSLGEGCTSNILGVDSGDEKDRWGGHVSVPFCAKSPSNVAPQIDTDGLSAG